MSDFRADVEREMINAAGHPVRVHAVLGVLASALNEKIRQLKLLPDGEAEDIVRGLQESYVFVMNMKNDISAEYGILQEAW